MTLRQYCISIALGVTCSLVAQSPKEIGLETINKNSAEAIISFLADDSLEGREAGKNGATVSAQYLRSRLKEMGVISFEGTDDFLQSFVAYHPERQHKGRWQIHPDSIAKLKKEVHQIMHMNNVIGMIPGERADELIFVGAHFDHLGKDDFLDGDKIYNGADDNASGVSAALQIAKAFVASKEKPLRTVVFAFWDGEEKGLLGSRYFMMRFARKEQIKAYLNFDMIGRNNKPEEPQHVVYFYTAAHEIFGDWLKNDIKQYHLNLKPDYHSWDKPIGGSDNTSFAKYDIPVIWYHTDWHPDYHMPSDHADSINYEKVVEITKASFLNAWNLANEKFY